MNFQGLIIGLVTFMIIGLFHPIVIKAEYYWGKKSWWVFMLAGLIFCILSMLTSNFLLSAICGATAFSCFWSIIELFEQEKRVKKGWFPANPKKQNNNKAISD